MVKRNYCIDILIENATSYTEKSKIYSLTEAEQAVVNDRMISNLYQSALKRKNVDFDNIPTSKGDIQKFNGYENMVATLEVLKGLSKKFGIQIPEITVVDEALHNIKVNKNFFEKGFGLNIDFLKMYYNVLVCACVDASCLMVASYVEYTKTVNNIEFALRKGKGVQGHICLDSLKKFNESVKKGEFAKFAKGLIDKGQENFLGGGAMTAATVVAIGASIIPVLRALIYCFYEARMSLSEKMQFQKEMLELNKFRLESSSMDAQKRNKIIASQQKTIEKLDKWADKIRVDQQLSNKNAESNLKQDNKNYNISNVSNGDGFMFI